MNSIAGDLMVCLGFPGEADLFHSNLPSEISRAGRELGGIIWIHSLPLPYDS